MSAPFEHVWLAKGALTRMDENSPSGRVLARVAGHVVLLAVVVAASAQAELVRGPAHQLEVGRTSWVPHLASDPTRALR